MESASLTTERAAGKNTLTNELCGLIVWPTVLYTVHSIVTTYNTSLHCAYNCTYESCMTKPQTITHFFLNCDKYLQAEKHTNGKKKSKCLQKCK